MKSVNLFSQTKTRYKSPGQIYLKAKSPEGYKSRTLKMIMVAGLIVMSCNLGGGGTEELSGPELTATYNAVVNQVQTENAPSGGDTSGGDTGGGETQGDDAVEAPTSTPEGPPTATVPPAPTVPGAPAVTANVNANVREGPSTNFKGVGVLLNGQSATIEGKDPTGTWFFIIFTAGPGGKAWIAASVVTTSGDVNSVPVVNSPATYTSTPTSTPTATPTPTATATSADTATPEPLWAGTWDLECPPDTCFPTVLTESGSNVSGSFNWDDGSGSIVATLVGTLSGKTLTGTITLAGGTPEAFTVTLTGGGTFVDQQWTGTWAGLPFCGSRPAAPFVGC